MPAWFGWPDVADVFDKMTPEQVAEYNADVAKMRDCSHVEVYPAPAAPFYKCVECDMPQTLDRALKESGVNAQQMIAALDQM